MLNIADKVHVIQKGAMHGPPKKPLTQFTYKKMVTFALFHQNYYLRVDLISFLYSYLQSRLALVIGNSNYAFVRDSDEYAQ